VSATGNQVRVPYSVFYDVDGDKIKALRIYMPMDQLLAQIGGVTEPEVARSKG
jgi:thioredoxin-related protein